jgi:hypothetical protein
MLQIVRRHRCPRCAGWLVLEPDAKRPADYHITCGPCGWETLTYFDPSLGAYLDPFGLEDATDDGARTPPPTGRRRGRPPGARDHKRRLRRD